MRNRNGNGASKDSVTQEQECKLIPYLFLMSFYFFLVFSSFYFVVFSVLLRGVDCACGCLEGERLARLLKLIHK
jgi:hypothetical protein